MSIAPFITLAEPRQIGDCELPADLLSFYSTHEGLGLDCEAIRAVRLALLEEVAYIDGWSELAYGLADPSPDGWEDFKGFRIGIGMFFEEIVFVVEAPSCPPGSILALGGNVAGPGGNGTGDVEPSLVLGKSFSDWLAHMQRYDWCEPAIACDRDLTDAEYAEVIRYYRELNPAMRFAID